MTRFVNLSGRRINPDLIFEIEDISPYALSSKLNTRLHLGTGFTADVHETVDEVLSLLSDEPTPLLLGTPVGPEPEAPAVDPNQTELPLESEVSLAEAWRQRKAAK